MKSPEEGDRVDGGFLCPLHLQGETGPASGGRVATVVSGGWGLLD